MKKILLIDDSALMRRVLSVIINETKEYTVAYIANNGLEGLEIIETHDDIMAVICDVNMPKMSGIELLSTLRSKNIMLPMILLSSKDDATYTIAALELGALDFLKKPDNIYKMDNLEFSDKLGKTLKLACELKNKGDGAISTIVRTKTNNKITDSLRTKHDSIRADGNVDVHQHNGSIKSDLPDKTVDEPVSAKKADVKVKRLIALVSSTGGPKALRTLIPMLPANLAAPVVMVQHMPANFTTTLADRLNELSPIRVSEASDGDIIKKGHVYLAPGGMHLKVTNRKGTEYIELDDSPPVVGLKPCGNIMYDSLCDSIYDEIVCVVLTGMGADGTNGITDLSKKKKVYVIAQDEASSTVYGMPKAIYEKGMCDVVCDINDVAKEIIKKVGVL